MVYFCVSNFCRDFVHEKLMKGETFIYLIFTLKHKNFSPAVIRKNFLFKACFHDMGATPYLTAVVTQHCTCSFVSCFSVAPSIQPSLMDPLMPISHTESLNHRIIER